MEDLAALLGIQAVTLQRLLWSLGAVLLAAVINLVARRLVAPQIEDAGRRYSFLKGVNYAVGFVAVLAITLVWTRGGVGLATYLGILSAGLAIALQDPLANLAGWLFIVLRKPFRLGDRIQVGDQAGDVIDVRLFQFSIVEIGNWVDADQSTGRIIHIPNGRVFRIPVANYTQGFNFVWEEIPVTVTFESDWERAKELLGRIAEELTAFDSEKASGEVRRAASRYMIHYQHLTPIVWTSVVDNGVTLSLRYLTEPRRRRSNATNIWEAILREFAAAEDIDFAYPTWRVYRNPEEGKPGAGGPANTAGSSPADTGADPGGPRG